MNTRSLIEETEIQVEIQIDKFKEKFGEEPNETIVWCVFDKDSFSDEDFGNAINKAKAKGYKVAYSNEAFELWFLLHFHYYDMALGRDDYIVKLTEHLKRKYRKNDLFMYETLLSKQEEAIKNAKKLLSKYIPVNPSNNNPSTTVFELVEYLNQFIHY